MLPTKTTDFPITNTPCKMDITGLFADSFRAAGSGVGFHFLPDDFRVLHQQGKPISRNRPEALPAADAPAKTAGGKPNIIVALTGNRIDGPAAPCIRAFSVSGLEISGNRLSLRPTLNAYSFLELLTENMKDASKGIDLSGVRNDFAVADQAVRAEGVRLTKERIEVAVRLSVPVIRVFAGPQAPIKDWQTASGDAKRDEVGKWMADDLRACAEYGETFGVIVAIQNHGDFLNTGPEHLSLLKRVAHPWCGPLIDTGKYLTDDPYADIALMVAHAVNWQIKETLGSSLIGSCKPGNTTRGGGSSGTGTAAAAQSDDAEIKVRVAKISKQLSRNGKLPGVLLDARFVEEKVGDGFLGPADFFAFYALIVPASDITAWRAFLAASPVVNGRAAYAAPKAVAPWWVGAADFGKLELFGPKPLTGWFNGWVGPAPDGRIFIYSFTM